MSETEGNRICTDNNDVLDDGGCYLRNKCNCDFKGLQMTPTPQLNLLPMFLGQCYYFSSFSLFFNVSSYWLESICKLKMLG